MLMLRRGVALGRGRGRGVWGGVCGGRRVHVLDGHEVEATQAVAPLASLVTAEQVLALETPPLLLDASWYLSPGAGESGWADFMRRRVRAPKSEPTDARDAMANAAGAQGAVDGTYFVDIDAVADSSAGLPHSMPTQEVVTTALAKFGLTPYNAPGSHIVVYDSEGCVHSPRVWWMLRAFGIRNVSVLAESVDALEPPLRDDHPLDAEAYMLRLTSNATAVNAFAPYCEFELDPTWIAPLSEVEELATAAAPGPTTRLWSTSGPPAGSTALRPSRAPACLLEPGVAGTTRLRSPEVLAETIAAAVGDRGGAPVIASCGSGVTACVLALAAQVAREAGLPAPSVRVYDGSWSEWGQDWGSPAANNAHPVVTSS
ncbi:rhodanese domain-containing protein [Thecamonas trahens ATCC 50062]|uniref:Rhodanese domain-containing protein n=1 Tax=Thecamonas trahens ATCC 50062 TaxID=461836 RepID=A0A0L0DSL1_THETB|nr:rhodanese domain-containing protein [Thecamonas trahens ATCC 50062]KNC55021.1 rhodanese domain-containing protein [Thecamonas trahens ATCC 50062]|eukprot:XP_013753330.1 rhodanese domain-containing protein [Thecamonas trahens ATCC 50062]